MFNKMMKTMVAVLVLGMSAALPALAQQDNTTTPSPVQVEIVGTVANLTADGFVLGGLTIDTSEAEINVLLEDGLLVKVQGHLLDADTVLAREVNAPGENFTPNDFEITGILDDITADGDYVVGGMVITPGNRTEIDPLIEIGMPVHVQGVFLTDGTLFVREIRLASEDDLLNSGNSGDDNSDDNSNTNGNITQVLISPDDAIAIVLGIYPNTRIVQIEFDDEDDRPIWKIDTSHGMEIRIDANSGVILVIQRDDRSNGDGLSNDDHSNDDHGGQSHDDDDDDHSGHGRGGDDDHEDHSGRRGGDDSHDD